MYTYSYAIVILLYTLQLTSIKLCPLYTGLAVHTGRYTLQHCYFIVHLCTLQLTSIKLCPLYTGLAVHTGPYTLQHCYFIIHLYTLQVSSCVLYIQA